MRTMMALAALVLAGGAQAQSVGRTLHYERTNIDGSEPEQIWFHRSAGEGSGLQDGRALHSRGAGHGDD
jgi:hypothetical protein